MKYRAYCWKTQYGFFDVEAPNPKEAERIARQKLWNGEEMDGWNDQDGNIEEVEKT
jgi:hypothetical protein